MQRFKTYIAIDDTDAIGYATSTGEICEEIREHIEHYYAKTTTITRHQLLLHEDIPYTSHNSSMCFSTSLSPREFEDVQKFIIDYVMMKSAPSSAPGICMGFEKDFYDLSGLITYGLDAKQKVLTKESAYAMAKKQNLFLKELKNRGDGIIGALAGVALRASGYDGRIKGKVIIDKKILSIHELLALGIFDEIREKNKKTIDVHKMVVVREYLKGIYFEHKSILLVEEYEDYYKPLLKEDLLTY